MITWGSRIEKIEDKAFRTFITVYTLFKIERLNANIKVTHNNKSLGPQ
jgi:hypothetical protein